MSSVPYVRALRPAVLVAAACAWMAPAPVLAQTAQLPPPISAPLPQRAVTVPAAQLNQLLRGQLVDAFDQALITQWSIETLQKEQQARPADVRIPIQMAAYYSLQNDAAKTVEYLSMPATMQPDNPETCCLVPAYLFGVVAQTDRPQDRLTAENLTRGLSLIDRTLRMKPDYLPALLYKTMLLVVQAAQEQDAAKQLALTQEAQAVRARFSTLALAAGLAGPPENSIPVGGPSMPAVANVVRAGGDIKYPTRLSHVEPEYPEAARQAGVQGVVILEALINEDGKVNDARVMRSIPGLDEAALAAVRQWVFAPTLVKGVPVKVIMTVTVNFPPKATAER